MKIDDAFGIHEQALKLKARRAEVLASNIANADTPGYKARDFDFRALLRQQAPQAVRLQATRENHIQSGNAIVPSNQMSYRIPNQPNLDGNTVDSQLEHAAYAQNAIEYQASLRFLDGQIRQLMLAIRGQ